MIRSHALRSLSAFFSILAILAILGFAACTVRKPTAPVLTPPAGVQRGAPTNVPAPVLTPQDLAQEPGGIETVRIAYTLLLDKYYKPLKSDDLLRAAWDGVLQEASREKSPDSADAPKLTGDQKADFAAFAASFDAATAHADKAKCGVAAVDAMARSLDDDHTTLLPADLFKRMSSTSGDDDKHQVFSARMLANGIGYMKLTSFPPGYEKLQDGKTLAQDLDDALNGFEAQGVRGLILDLRNNSGGHTESVSTIAGRFIPSGLQETDVDAKGDRLEVPFDGHYFAHRHPLAVLINGGSASAAEITAAALKDYGVARIFGTRSAGAVNGAEIFPLPGQVGLEYTVVEVRAGKTGKPLDKVGVEPDQVVSQQSGDDAPLQAAETWLSSSAASAPAPAGTPIADADALKPDQVRNELGRYGADVKDIPPLPNLRLLGDVELTTPDEYVVWAPCTAHAAQLAQTVRDRGWQGQYDQFFGSGDPFTYQVSIDLYKDVNGAQQALGGNECPEGFQTASLPIHVGDQTLAMKGTGVLLGWTLLRWRQGRTVFSAYYYSEPTLESFDPLAQIAKAVSQRYEANPLK